MKRTVLIAIAVVLIAAVVIVAAGPRARQIAVRFFHRETPPAASSAPASAPKADMPGMPTSAETPRGDLTLDTRRQQLIGVRTATVARTLAAPVVRAAGIVRYDETRQKEINLKIEGWIRHLNVDYTGRRVAQGDTLFMFYSPEILATEREYLLAVRTRDTLAQSQVHDVHEHAEQLVTAARQRLALWDVPANEIAALDHGGEPQGIVVFRSPVSGTVIEKQALEGMHVMPGQALFKLADLATVWVEADIYERDAQSVHVGTPASVSVDAYPGRRFAGKTTFIYPSVNEETRTLKARLSLPNPGELLKPGMYAQVELTAPSTPALVAPSDAVLDSGTEQVIFLAQGDGYFQPRKVKTGRRLADAIEIVEGLKEGDQIATSAAFFLDSESQLRGSLQSFEPTAPAGSTAALAASLDIAFRSNPDPTKTGENTFEVTVKDASGKPIADAQVSLQFYMPAMPTMNMPAMRNTITLPAAGGGAYRGNGEVMMAGRWEVTVMVTKSGKRLGSKQVAVVSR